MVRIYFVLMLVFTLLVFTEQTAKAQCTGFIDCWLGLSNQTEIRNERMVEQSRIEAQRDAEVTRLQGEADARVKEAEAEVERVRQQQFQTAAQRDIAIAEAQRKAEEYKMMIAGLVDERKAEIIANADTQIATLQEQTKIAIAGITETGATERTRVRWSWGLSLVIVLVLGGLMYFYMHRRVAPTVLLIDGKGSPRQQLSQEEIGGYLNVEANEYAIRPGRR